MDTKDIENAVDAFLGKQGEEKIRQARVILSSGYNIVDKAKKALDAASELTNAVEVARENMKDGYEHAKTIFAPGALAKFKDVYGFLKKFGIIKAFEGMK